MGSTELNIFEGKGKKKHRLGFPPPPSPSLHLHMLSHQSGSSQSQLTLLRCFRACSLGDFPCYVVGGEKKGGEGGDT